jgi:heat shock protein HslJ
VQFEGGDRTVLTPAPEAQYTIAFGTDGRFSARIDCNRGAGTWKSSGPSMLEFGPLALTRAMCPQGSLHDQIVRQWPYVRSYVLRDGMLHISLMADGGIYTFAPAYAEGAVKSSVSLESTTWTLVALGDAPARSGSGTQAPYLVLDPTTRTMRGWGGCNRLTGGYTLQGDGLSFGHIATTLMACPDTERQFLQALGRVAAWRITGQELALLDDQGNMVARFQARPTA